MIEINTLSESKSRSIWATFAKNLVILTACIGVGAGSGWLLAKNQQSQWQVSAQFEPPKVADLGNYYALASTYALLQGSTGENVYTTISEQSFTEFKRMLTSPNIQQQFLRQNEIVKKRAEFTQQPFESTVQTLQEQFQFQEKTNRLTLILDNPEIANQLLSQFIEFVAAQAKLVLNQELVEKWKVLFQQVKNSAETNLGAIQIGSQVAQQDWKGKLSLMKLVQPLDNKLVAYHFVQSPTLPHKPYSPDYLLWLMIGALSGLTAGLFLLSLIGIRRKLK